MNSPANLLVIAYHFPPIQGSSGFLRTLKFVRYLPESGVKPHVLTVHPRAYAASDMGLMDQVPPGVEVHRAFALDAGKHMAYRGRYPAFLSVPDRYWTWIPAGILMGLRLLRSRRIDVLFSTYPIPSAHAIALCLARLTGKPWIADFRDPMWDPRWMEYDCGISPAELKARDFLEKRVVARASAVTVTTDTMAQMFRQRYPEHAGKFVVIPNGFDENDFSGLPAVPGAAASAPGTAGTAPAAKTLTFIHAGLLDPIDRDPMPFFRGLALARERGGLPPGRLQVKFHAPGNGPALQEELKKMGVEDMVRILGSIPYRSALQAMAESDALLLFQGPTCDRQIPAKLYEYLRIGRPILALTTEEGETGKLVQDTRSGEVVAWDDPERIAEALTRWIGALAEGRPLPAATRETASRFSRQSQARHLGELVAKARQGQPPAPEGRPRPKAAAR